MQKQLADLEKALTQFTHEQHHSLLILSCEQNDLPFVLAAMERMKQNDPDVLPLVWNHPVSDLQTWVSLVVRALEQQRQRTNQALKEERKPLLPALPVGCFDGNVAALERFRAAMIHLQQTLHNPQEQLLLLALLPSEVTNEQMWITFVMQLLATPMHNIRVVVSDGRLRPQLVPTVRVRKLSRVMKYTVNFDASGYVEQLQTQSVDRTQPLEQRMNAHLQLAMVDYSHRRYPQAIERYHTLMAYYDAVGAKGQRALCLLGLGDIAQATGHSQVALMRYQSGIVLAAQSQTLPVLLNLLLAAGKITLTLQQLNDAKSFYEGAAKIAEALRNFVAQADALEQVATIEYTQGHVRVAVERWHTVENIAMQLGDWSRAESVLLRQQQVYAVANMQAEVQQVNGRLAIVRSDVHRQQLLLGLQSQTGAA